MWGRTSRRSLCLIAAAFIVWASVSLPACAHARVEQAYQVADAETELQAVNSARALLPGLSVQVVVVDPDLSGDPAAIRRLDAFTVVEPEGQRRRKVYLNRESDILLQASRGVDFYIKVLAAVILHEVQHVEGASESEARRVEAEFFQGLIARGLVAREEGRRYLAVLHRRDAVAQ
jgi:hypothetical protein